MKDILVRDDRVSDKKVENPNKENRDIKIDTKSGSMAYNRLEMQVSQALYMAIKTFDDQDYLIVMDYYDDITLFDSEDSPDTVSYFQMKTSEEPITLNKAISEGWIAKMYKHFENIDWEVNELGLITNCPLVIRFDKEGKSVRDPITAERTSFMKFDQTIICKIKEKIANSIGLDKDSIDLTKIFHIITPLSILKHKEITEHEMGRFLNNKYPKITFDSIKTIHSTMVELLSKRQKYELLDGSESFDLVRSKKGVSKRHFEQVIDDAMLLSIPTFNEILRMLKFRDDENELSYEYVTIVADYQAKSELFTDLFKRVRNKIRGCKKEDDIDIKQYVAKMSEMIYSDDSHIKDLYNKIYVSILIVIIYINETRRK